VDRELPLARRAPVPALRRQERAVGTTHPPGPDRCRPCRKFFSVRTGTVMRNSNLGARVWVWVTCLLSTNLKGVASLELRLDLKATRKMARRLAHRIREAWNDARGPFPGPVEVDETFSGGKEGNRDASKKLRAGGGGKGKVAVVGMKDRDPNAVTAKVVDSMDRATLQGFVKGNIREGPRDIHRRLRFVPRAPAAHGGQPFGRGVRGGHGRKPSLLTICKGSADCSNRFLTRLLAGLDAKPPCSPSRR